MERKKLNLKKEICSSAKEKDKGSPYGIKTIEVEAITIEEAIRKALRMLKARESEVHITILQEEHKGLFGMEGAKPAKIRVTLKNSAEK